VSTGGGDLEGALGLRLSTNGRKVGFGRCPRRRHVADAGDQRSFAAQIVDASLQRRSAQRLDTLGKRSFRRVFHGHDEPPYARGGEASRHRQDAGDRAE
jgi:hypothetical protein